MFVKNKIVLSFFLLSAHLSYSACGYFDENGNAREIYGLETVAKRGGVIYEKAFSSFDIFDCNGDNCSLALRQDYLRPEYGCDTEEELIESVKKIYGREIHKGLKRAPFTYGNISKKLDLQSIYVGCDFLKVKTPKEIDSVSAFFIPQRMGFCPIIFDFPSACEDEHCKYFFENGISFFQITRDGKNWKINVTQHRSLLSTYVDEDSEFIYTEKPLDLFVEPCFKNECFFASIEKMPFSNSLLNEPTKNAVLIKQVERIKPLCDFIKVKETDEPGYTGKFIVDGVGTCKIEIQHKMQKVKFINVISKKVNDNYRILIK